MPNKPTSPGSAPAARLPRSLLRRVGEACARRYAWVFAAWVLILIALVAGSRAAGGVYSDNVNLSGTQAATGSALMAAHDPAAAGSAGTVVFHVGQGSLQADQGAVAQTVTNLSRLPHVRSATSPLRAAGGLSADGRTGVSTLHMDQAPKQLGSGYVSQLDSAVAPARHAGVQVEYGGDFDQITRPKAVDGQSEAIGFAVALVVLLIGFGSVAAAALPLLAALFAVLVGLSALGIVSAAVTFGTSAPTLALMIGLGVGIDYALFLVTRQRQQLIDGADPVRAAGESVATSGRAVLVAAGTVSAALLGLYASGLAFLGTLGFAAVFGVVTAAAGAVTLVPAAFGLLGTSVDRLRVGRVVAEEGREDDGWHRYAAMVGRRPWAFLALGVVLLGVLAVPLLSIRLGHVDDGADPVSFTDKRAYDLVASSFGPGANGPFTIVVSLPAGTSAATATQLGQHVRAELASVPDVARAGALSPTPDGALLVGSLTPATAPQTAATTTLFHRLVDTTIPDALAGSGAHGYVTGSTPTYIQFAGQLTARLPVVIAVVVAAAFLLVLTAFRSPLLAVKAAACNLASIAAAYGVVVAVFQWGWGRGLLGISENVPIESYVPVLMFAIVFGLSMDYEIFLLTRVKERWDRRHDQHAAVAGGLSATGRVITCAALIMASVFTAFVASDQVVIKMIAIGLASSVLLDATIVRLLLVPAVMYLLGARSWWLPRWLDRLLPHIDIEPDSAELAPPTALPAV